MGVRRQPDGMSEANLQRSHPRRGASKVDTNITMITSGASCRGVAASRRRIPPVLPTAWVPLFGSQCRLSRGALPESISQTETQTEISGLVRINGAHLGIIAEMVADTRLHVETQLRQDIYLNAGSTVY